MGHTVNSLAKRLLKLEGRVCELEDELGEYQEKLDEVAERTSQKEDGPDRRWVMFVNPEDFEPLDDEGYACETDDCDNGTWPEDEGGSVAHWAWIAAGRITELFSKGDCADVVLPSGVFIPEFICSTCFQAILKDRREE